MTTDEILQAAARTFKERAAVYRDNPVRYGNAMLALFPNGLQLNSAEDHHRFHLFALAVVKLTRYAVQWENGHQDSVRDAAVYLAMLEACDANRNQHGQHHNQQRRRAKTKSHLA